MDNSSPDELFGMTPRVVVKKTINNDEEVSMPLSHPTDGDKAERAGSEGEPSEARVQWNSKMEFLLSTIGFAVDLSNVFRFPNTCYSNGGGAFLIPYFCMLALCALPLFYMELLLGQYNRQGCISVWNKVCPIMKGVGVASCVMNFYVALFYNSVIAWSFYYLFSSFTSVLPWTRCDQTYNTEFCWNDAKQETCLLGFNGSAIGNFTEWSGNGSICHPDSRRVSSASEYFDYHVLGLREATGFHDLGPPKWDLSLCLALTFVCLYFSLFKGVKSMGVAVWITALLPYIVLSILLVRGLMLPGALDGIKYFIRPSFGKLLDIKVWSDAAVQIFFSLGSGFGVHLAYASYNDFHNGIFNDCVIATLVNSFTSLFSGFVVFTFLGYLSAKSGTPIDSVVGVNSGLVFTVYPEALSTIPGAPFWSVLFFIMLLTLGLDSSFGALEALLTAVTDEYKKQISRMKYSREITTGVACIIIYLCALPNVTYGGMYVYRFLEEFGAGVSILVAVVMQCLCVSWVYGLHNFSNDVNEMLGSRPWMGWRILWKVVTPVILLVLSVYSLCNVKNPHMQYSNGDFYHYPSHTKYLGWLVVLSSISFIPIFAIWTVLRMDGRSIREKIALSISPSREHDEIREQGNVTRFGLQHWLNF
uniref:Transporter n=1 Tax=Macrostomum lignano TaxID=282301 RepID=A0A1I8H4N8_9PLAT